jgi:gliding motility-associated-like protein
MKPQILHTVLTYRKYLWGLCLLFFSGLLSAQPVASFISSPKSGCAPLSVNFTDNSTGNPVKWTWNLGNGNSSVVPSPSTIYYTPGLYPVNLKVSNSNGTDDTTIYITVYDKPIVDFTVPGTTGCAPFTVNFKDQSSASPGKIIAWEWNFGDETPADTRQNPDHTFLNAGNYNITLKAVSELGCTNTKSISQFIKVLSPIKIDFNFTSSKNCKPPETIQFASSSTGLGILSYSWDFGDSSARGTNKFTAHQYLSGGLYSIKLIVSNNIGCKDSLEKKDTLPINNIVSTISGPDTFCLNSSATYFNSSAPAPRTFYWDLGDSVYSSDPIVTMQFASVGIYTIKTVNEYATCTDTAIKKITIIDLPAVDFKADDSASCKVPLQVNFTDLTPGAASWQWDFGDGGTSTDQNPFHKYITIPADGQQTVKLTIKDIHGCTNSKSIFNFIQIQQPAVSFSTAEGGGCIPYVFKPYPSIFAPGGVESVLWDFGDGTTSADTYPSHTYTALGNYDIKLTVKTKDGCIGTAIVTEGVKIGSKPTADFSAAPTQLCAGSPVQFTDLSVPSSIDKWLWNFGDNGTSIQQNPVYAYNDTGKFTISLIVWNNGCRDTAIKINYITIDPAIALFNPVYNCNNKKEVFFKDSSKQALFYSWDFGDGVTSTDQNPVHLFSNYQDYTVTLTVSNGTCTDTSSQIIKVTDEKPDFITLKDSVCKSGSILFTAANINTANIDNYIWDYGDGKSDTLSSGSSSHQYDTAGIFTVKLSVTDIHGCNESVIKPAKIHIFSPKANFVTNAPGVCSNKDLIFTDQSTTADGNNNIVNWLWKFGDGQTNIYTAPPPATVTHFYTIDGKYFPKLIITDALGCIDSFTNKTPLIITNPIASFSADKNITCNNDTIKLNNFSTGKNLKYQWDFGDSTNATVRLPRKIYTTNGLYNIRLIVTDLYGCKDTAEKSNYIDVKEVTAGFKTSATRASCLPFDVKFTDTSINETYRLWRYGDGSASVSPSPTHQYVTSDTFFAKLIAYRGQPGTKCTDTATVTIIVNAPTASLAYSPLEGCAPLNVAFNISSTKQLLYKWDFGDGNISDYTTTADTLHTYNYPQNYTPSVLIRDAADQTGCEIPVIGKNLIKLYSSAVNFEVADTTLVCDSGFVTFKNLTVSGSPVVRYLWSFGDGDTSNLKDPVHYYRSEGFYNVGLSIFTAFGCKDSLIKTNYIRVAKKPDIAIGGTTEFCGPSIVELKGLLLDSDGTSIIWDWDFGNGNSSDLQNPPAQQYSNISTYPVILKVKSNSGCADTATVNVNIHAVPIVFSGNDTAICLNTSAQLSVTGSTDSYAWQPVTGLSCVNCPSPVATPANSIVYTVTGTTIFGCTGTDTVAVEVKKPFTLSGMQPLDSVCAGKGITLSVSGAENYIWSPAAGLSNTNSASVTASPTAGTIYKVTGYDSKNCFFDSAFIDLRVNPNPTVKAGEDQVLHLSNSTTLPIEYSSDVNGWLWSPATGLSCFTCAAPIATPEISTTYTITVTNSSKCTATDEVFIKVVCDNTNLFLPTAFTPNKDGLNDVFYPMGVGLFKIQSLRIFNRYGQVVFLKTNFNANDRSAGWNGSFKGKMSDMGAYIYTLEVICKNGEVLIINGKILLIQ